MFSIQRGDSLDTIFTSSPPTDDGVSRKSKQKRHTSPRRKRTLSAQDSTESSSMQLLGSKLVIDDVTGNITRVPDSVVLNIESTSSTNTSSNESDNCDEDDDDEDGCIEEQLHEMLEEEEASDDDNEEFHSNDWEIRMLAAELNRRESKRDDTLSSEMTSEVDDNIGMMHSNSHHRSDTLDTESEYSELENEQMARPRAASLDQYNLTRRHRAKGIMKALSFDRDKDRL